MSISESLAVQNLLQATGRAWEVGTRLDKARALMDHE